MGHSSKLQRIRRDISVQAWIIYEPEEEVFSVEKITDSSFQILVCVICMSLRMRVLRNQHSILRICLTTFLLDSLMKQKRYNSYNF